MSPGATDQYIMEVSHSEGSLTEFKSVVPGQPVGLELGRKQWEALGFPGRVILHVQAVTT